MAAASPIEPGRFEGTPSARGQSAHDRDRACSRCFDPIFGIETPPNLDRYLYHYTSISTLSKIQETMALRFRPLRDMNDPQESQVVLPQFHVSATRSEDAVLTREENERFLNHDWVSDVNAERHRAKVGSFVMDREPDLRRLADDDELRKVLAPAARFAARGFAHPRMWAQYAANHTGACLVFDWPRLHDAVEGAVDEHFPWARGQVRYSLPEYGPHIGSIDIKMLLEGRLREALFENYESAFLEKHPDWAQEVEYRFVLFDGTEEPFLVPIDAGCLAGLVVGPQSDPTKDRSVVEAFAREFDITSALRQATWPAGRGEVPPVAL